MLGSPTVRPVRMYRCRWSRVAVDCYCSRAVAGSGGDCHLGDRVIHAGSVRDVRAGKLRAQRARTDRQAAKVCVVGEGSTCKGNGVGLSRRVLGGNYYRDGVRLAHSQAGDDVVIAAGHVVAVDCYCSRAVAGSGGDCHLGDRVIHAGSIRDVRAGKLRAQRARTDRQAAKVCVVGEGSTCKGNGVGLSRRVLGGNYYRDGVRLAHIQAGDDVVIAAGHDVAVDCYCSRAVAGSGGDCHLGDRVIHAGSVRDVRAGKLRAQRARTDRQAAKVCVVGEGSTCKGNGIGLSRRVLGSNYYRDGVRLAHIQAGDDVTGAAGHDVVVDCYCSRAVAGSGGDCHLGDRVIHAGSVRDVRAGKLRAQRARTDRQAAKVCVVGERCGTCKGNGVGLSRRVLGSNYYRDGVGAHIQAGDDVTGAAGHDVVVDCYCSRAVAGSGGDCHLGDRVIHAGSVRDVRAGKLRAQRARTDRQAAKVCVVGERCSTCKGNGIGLSRRVLGSNYYRDGVGAHIQAGDDVTGAAGHDVVVDCYCSRAVAGSGGDCHLGDRVIHAGSVRDVRAGKLRAQRARTDRQAGKVGVVGEGGGRHTDFQHAPIVSVLKDV